jgi:hypothetical protein
LKRTKLAAWLAFYQSFMAADQYPALCVFRKRLFAMSIFMLSDTSAVVSAEPAQTAAEIKPAISEWGEMALTVMFTLAAVLFVSFLAVVTGLV